VRYRVHISVCACTYVYLNKYLFVSVCVLYVYVYAYEYMYVYYMHVMMTFREVHEGRLPSVMRVTVMVLQSNGYGVTRNGNGVTVPPPLGS
jgi:hypothetical protein